MLLGQVYNKNILCSQNYILAPWRALVYDKWRRFAPPDKRTPAKLLKVAKRKSSSERRCPLNRFGHFSAFRLLLFSFLCFFLCRKAETTKMFFNLCEMIFGKNINMSFKIYIQRLMNCLFLLLLNLSYIQ